MLLNKINKNQKNELLNYPRKLIELFNYIIGLLRIIIYVHFICCRFKQDINHNSFFYITYRL